MKCDYQMNYKRDCKFCLLVYSIVKIVAFEDLVTYLMLTAEVRLLDAVLIMSMPRTKTLFNLFVLKRKNENTFSLLSVHEIICNVRLLSEKIKKHIIM